MAGLGLEELLGIAKDGYDELENTASCGFLHEVGGGSGGGAFWLLFGAIAEK
jgi:hypothetical protein